MTTPEEVPAGDSPRPPGDDVSRETVAAARAPEYFGQAYPAIAEFAHRLETEGEERGLIGPREVGRIWSRHIFNSAAVVPFLPASGSIADLGSGAGLPGLVIAAMLPQAEVVLVEPMERRCVWLGEMKVALDLRNVDIRRGRAEEFHGAIEVDAVTARAVAALDKLVRWGMPLLKPSGELVVLKGRSVEREVPVAQKALRRFGAGRPEIVAARTIPEVDDTVVVRVARRG